MSDQRSETLVIVERETGFAIELRQVVREGDKAFLIFARSDGSDAYVEIDPANLRAVSDGRIEVEFQYRGGAVKAPKQEVDR